MLDISRDTVKVALSSADPPKYQRRPMGSVADAAEPRIRELLAAYPRMPATAIAEPIGWSYSIRTLSGRLRELRPLYLAPDLASRTTCAAGQIAQCDFWFPNVVVPVDSGQVRTSTALPVFTMVCGYSRWASAALVLTRSDQRRKMLPPAGIQIFGRSNSTASRVSGTKSCSARPARSVPGGQ